METIKVNDTHRAISNQFYMTELFPMRSSRSINKHMTELLPMRSSRTINKHMYFVFNDG